MTATPTAAARLAQYAASLRLGDVPQAVVETARDCVADTVAAAIHGHASPAGRMVAAYARRGAAGRSLILGGDGTKVGAEQAALANGTLAHALELDSLRQPSAGVHPGAVLVPAALAIAQEEGRDGAALLASVIAGCEVLVRVGRASKHSPEARGFHAPGLTGPYGAAATAGHLLGLDAEAMTRAFGIAGSLGGGLLEFAASGDGGMVKRLHLGRAAAAGVLAARLAQSGFTGPASVFDGPHGFLHAYCGPSDASALTAELGTRFETSTICFKAYACHITAHTPVHAVRLLRAEYGFTGAEIASVTVHGTAKMAALHANTAPADGVAAQYSIAFCVAAALLHDPAHPASFIDTRDDPAVRDLCARVMVLGDGGFTSAWATRTQVALRDGRILEKTLDEVPGFATAPFDAAQRRGKFLALTRRLGPAAEALFDRLEGVADEPDLAWLGAGGSDGQA